MPGTGEWNTKQKNIQQDFLWALRPEPTHQTTKSQNRSDPDNIKIDKLIKLHNKYYLAKRNKYNPRGDFFWAKQTDKNTPEDHWQKVLELEKECNFPEFSTELLMSKIVTSLTDRKLRDKLMEEKTWDVPKVVKEIQ